MMDGKAIATGELSLQLVPGEDACTVEGSVARCTWERFWKRRFRVFNRGSQGMSLQQVVEYADNVVEKSQLYEPRR